MTQGTAGAPPTVRDFTVLLPPGWARIPLDDKIPARVKRLVQDRVSTAPPEHREALRAALSRDLNETLRSAARQGGLDVLLSLDPVAGEPVPASALVTHLSGDTADLSDLLPTLASGSDGVVVSELDVVEIDAGRAVRRLSTREEQVEAVGDLAGGVLQVTQLEYFVPVPGTSGILVLAFSTPIAALGPPLVKLFDVIARSLRWVTTA